MTRHAQLLEESTRRWDEKLIRDAIRDYSRCTPAELRDLVLAAYRDRDVRAISALERLEPLPNFFELLGGLHGHGSSLPLELVDRFWASAVVTAWRDWSPAIEAWRQHSGIPTIYQRFETLANALGRRRAYGTKS
jgi:hypothetical protein